ncbi:MAG: response regulator, partial [Ignavibacteria bacterium]|nr:response regulator [Ignavibacteria bacterium]
VYNIIKKHDGFINVESKINEGTTFEIYLPYESISPSISKVQLEKGEKLKILLADDEKSIRELLAEMLTLQGYEVYQAESTKDVMEILSLIGGNLDLMILDYYLSDANADEILNNLKAMKKSIPTFVATGVQDDSILNKLKSMDVVKIIEKPYDFDTILNSINEITEISTKH